jgi:hypothetical protein
VLFACAAGLAVVSSHSVTLDSQGAGTSEDAVISLVNFARRDIDAHWSRTIKGYRPPADVVMIRVPATTDCGSFDKPNAAYCPSTNKIYWDMGMFLTQHKIGDFAPVYVLAHEFGHMVQRMLGFAKAERKLMRVQLELQADCFAGEYALDARNRKVLEEGDDDEAAVSLRRAGDRLDDPWFDESAHGTPGQRIDAFTYGFDGRDCAADAFFDFLKTRGIDPAKVPQQPAPSDGALGTMLPRSVGRFTLVTVTRTQHPKATDGFEGQYRTPDGITVTVGLTSHRNRDDSASTLADYVTMLVSERGFTEINRVNLVGKDSGQPVGLAVTLVGKEEVVVWSNNQTVVSVVGPRDIPTELYRIFPF